MVTVEEYTALGVQRGYRVALDDSAKLVLDLAEVLTGSRTDARGLEAYRIGMGSERDGDLQPVTPSPRARRSPTWKLSYQRWYCPDLHHRHQ